VKRIRRIGLSLVLAVALLVAFALPVSADNPVVQITVTAQVVSISNSQNAWAIGVVTLNDVKYFSANNAEDDDYSLVTNTGSVAVDVALDGTDFDGTDALDWVLAAAAGSEQYSLYANSGNGTATYNIEVDKSSTNFLVETLPVDGTYKWSMNFTAPSAFDASEDGEPKSASVTLVSSKA